MKTEDNGPNTPEKPEHHLVAERLRKVAELRSKGIEPYPYEFGKTHNANYLLEKYGSIAAEEKTTDVVKVAGRIVGLRKMGKASFAHLQDGTGRIQIYLREDAVGTKVYDILHLADVGDIVGVEGTIFKTKTGEVTILVSLFEMLCKSIRPLPEKYHGLQDIELRYRQRYVDLIMNPQVKDVFVKRSQIIKAVREFMCSKGFLEVETPLLQTVYGGAEARPFVTHINAWNMDLYLSISPELFLKRLIIGGYEKVYTICKNFRNEGVDKTHNPEFTMMEFYQSYVDYHEMMRLTEQLFEYVAMKVLGKTQIEYEGKRIELKAPWKRITIKQALIEYAQIDVDKLSDQELQSLLTGYNIEYRGEFARGLVITRLFEELCESKLIQPTFVMDYPKEASPLCKRKRGNPELIEKVEPYINGWEIGNGYSELNEPVVQRRLLEEQSKEMRAGADERHPMDADFVNAIEVGMAPTGGMGIGIDRMIILLTQQPSLRDVLPFPTMKPVELSVEEQEAVLKNEVRQALKEHKKQRSERSA
ncbi:lysine--tRNA ligase [Candidatus Woesearchaeota archaeon]|nr:lysine--tRNA ligase [Candidatus Woesearchaeota archaeon]